MALRYGYFALIMFLLMMVGRVELTEITTLIRANIPQNSLFPSPTLNDHDRC